MTILVGAKVPILIRVSAPGVQDWKSNSTDTDSIRIDPQKGGAKYVAPVLVTY